MSNPEANYKAITSLSGEVKALTSLINTLALDTNQKIGDLSVKMAEFTDYKADKSAIEAKINLLSGNANEDKMEILSLKIKQEETKESVALLNKHIRQGVVAVFSALFGMALKLAGVY